MRVSTKYGFTFLCMPKCASSSIEDALLPYSQLITKGDVSLKHTNYKVYSKCIKPYIKKEIEVVCLMREPISWLHSWYKYRSRELLKSPTHSRHEVYCGDMTFEEWIYDYLSENPTKYIGRTQHSFVMNEEGEIGVDKIFKYENLVEIKNYFESKIKRNIDLPNLNISPTIKYKLSKELEKDLKSSLKKDYDIYNLL